MHYYTRGEHQGQRRKKKKTASNKEKPRKRIERSDHRDNIKEKPEKKI